MDLKAMFPNLNAMWPRWSSYEIRQYHGVPYLLPAANAEPLPYNCAEHPEALVADALELGRQVYLNSADIDRLCADFAARYGLLGLGASKDTGIFKQGAVAPCYRPFEHQKYGEIPARFQEELRTLYLHFLSCHGEQTEPNLAAPAIAGSLRYRLTSGQTPQLIWEADSLLTVLRLAYASMITNPGAPLKVCKNCGKVYYNSHTKSEFCGARCRNYYNVKMFREREKDHVISDCTQPKAKEDIMPERERIV